MTTRTGSTLGSAVQGGLGSPGVVTLAGPDARRFCNGMFTNNVRDLPVGGAQRSAAVDDRGRLWGLFDLLCTGPDTFLVVLDGLAAPAFLERLDRYVVFDDVALEDLTGRARLRTVQGPGAAEALGRAGLPVPAAGAFVSFPGGRSYPAARSPAGGFDLLLDDGPAPLPDVPELDAGALEVLRVAAGRIRFPDDTGDKGLPHELGLRDELLHFEKGCYIGQESINRIDVMGQVRRALAGVRVDGGPPPAGAEVLADGQRVGALTSPVRLPDGAGLALAVLRKPADTVGTTLVVQADGQRWDARVVPLPHPV